MLLTVCTLIGFYQFTGHAIEINNRFEDASDGQLKVMTFNIHGGRNHLDQVQLDDIVDEIRAVDPDIVGLQEVDVGMPRSRFINQVDEISKKLHMNSVFVPNINFIIGSYGDAVLSKYPITTYTHYKLPSQMEPRGLLKAEIRLGSQSISVYTTHLGLKTPERAQQFASIKAIMEQDTAPKLILGDFNARPIDPSFQRFCDQFANSNDGLTQSFVTFPSENTQIDYVLHTQEFKAIKIQAGRSLISDHNPLLYTLSMH